MSQSLETEITNLGGSTSDSVWRWIISNGPHGESFTWGQTRNNPPGCVGIEHLESIVFEKQSVDQNFTSRVLSAVKIALRTDNQHLLIRAIQIGAVVGTKEEVDYIENLTEHDSDIVSKHAKACLFYLKKKLK